ncbi:hypothetical protein KP79_PYT18765 [Mizuhopecten yessoensis]|uniref:Uncharacterized protein n=1 Tax=Mizuhopecten yessoensis TaxID=6573 RepID=A0A210Q3J6_MIZYE|nr:hypothetical protein KP79_PYT18765 [Mizuhopecten yessoensis]
MPSKGSRGKKGKGMAVPPPKSEPVQQGPAPEETDNSYPSEKAKRRKTVTAFSEQQKDEIIKFLMSNDVLYTKRLSGFKDVTHKEDLWAARLPGCQAAKMNSTVEQLKIWYASMRTMMGRLKKRAKKSGSGGDAFTDMNRTEKSTSACGSSYFGKFVEEILSKLPGQIRRDAEANIMQELHRAQRAAEHSQTQPPPSQSQQTLIQLQQQFQQATGPSSLKWVSSRLEN